MINARFHHGPRAEISRFKSETHTRRAGRNVRDTERFFDPRVRTFADEFELHERTAVCRNRDRHGIGVRRGARVVRIPTAIHDARVRTRNRKCGRSQRGRAAVDIRCTNRPADSTLSSDEAKHPSIVRVILWLRSGSNRINARPDSTCCGVRRRANNPAKVRHERILKSDVRFDERCAERRTRRTWKPRGSHGGRTCHVPLDRCAARIEWKVRCKVARGSRGRRDRRERSARTNTRVERHGICAQRATHRARLNRDRPRSVILKRRGHTRRKSKHRAIDRRIREIKRRRKILARIRQDFTRRHHESIGTRVAHFDRVTRYAVRTVGVIHRTSTCDVERRRDRARGVTRARCARD